MIEAVLANEEDKQITNMAIKMWLVDIRNLAYDLEGIMDHWGSWIVSAMEDITGRFEELYNLDKDPGLKEIAGVSSSSPSTAAVYKIWVLYKREKKKKRINLHIWILSTKHQLERK